MSSLEQFRTYLAQRYDAILGLKLGEVPTENPRNPVWLGREGGAWLLDWEIGLALRIVPYQDADQSLAEVVQTVLRSATLLQPRSDLRSEQADPAGMWQTGIVWLVEKPHLGDAWRTSMSTIRKESGFSEELGLDAIFINGSDLPKACDEHGLPQLLLGVRQLIGMGIAEMPAWLSANTRVAEMLVSFADQFAGDGETRQLAGALVSDAMKDHKAMLGSLANVESENRKIESFDEIEIRTFRNIQRCRLHFPKDKGRHAQAHVVFGPNGTGKTSLFEAICLASGGVSKGWEEYQADDDIETRARDYAKQVLTPLGSNESPRILLGGVEVPLHAASSAKEKWREVDGSFLGQEDSREFLDEPGAMLAERILKGYSTLADQITELASTRESAARNEKSAWLKEHGLNASISRRETRAQRLIESEVRKQSWDASQGLLDWLEKTSLAIPGLERDGQRLADRWRAWAGQQAKVIDGMASGVLIGEIEMIQSPLKDWLVVRNSILAETSSLIERARGSMEGLRARIAGVDRELDAWGEWLARQSSGGSKDVSEEHQALARQIDTNRERLKVIRQSGDLERKRAAHLVQLSRDFLGTWSQLNPDICPTCGDNHGKNGGIRKVIADVQAATEKRLTELESDEKRFAQELSILESRLSSLGLSPISEQRQRDLEALLVSFVGTDTLRARLVGMDSRAELKRTLREAQTLPDIPPALVQERLNDLTQRLAESALSLDLEAERLWPLPERWKKIVAALRMECEQIVAKHLPETLQKLWWEIAAALTSGRWNLIGKPVIQVKTQGKVIVGMAERPGTPARYLLNQAERHVLGMAWFVVRYLTFGRFCRSLVALDDPAQEMDQTTFRSFARFTQALLRIHETRGLPLQMVIFLHQEERALDIARATMGRLLMLNWRKSILAGEMQDVLEVRLTSEGFLVQNGLSLLLGEKSVSQ